MRPLVSVILFLLVSLSGFARDPGLAEIRSLYLQAGENRSLAEKLFHSVLEFDGSPGSVKLAYKGSARAMMAENAFSPVKKYQYFSEGKDMLEEAIKTSPDNPEIRFLRYMVQVKAPSFLGYDNKSDDLRFLIHYFSSHALRNADPYYIKILELLNNPEVVPEKEFGQINKIYQNIILSQTKSPL